MRLFSPLRSARSLNWKNLHKLFPRNNHTVLAVRGPGKDFYAYPIAQLKPGVHTILTVRGAQSQLNAAQGHYSPHSTQLSSSMTELALSYLAEGKTNEAIACYENLYELRQQVRGVTWEYSEVALALAKLLNGDIDGSHELLAKAYDTLPANFLRMLPQDSLGVITITHSLGITFAAQGNSDAALKMFNQAAEAAGNHGALSALAPSCHEASAAIKASFDGEPPSFSASR